MSKQSKLYLGPNPNKQGGQIQRALGPSLVAKMDVLRNLQEIPPSPTAIMRFLVDKELERRGIDLETLKPKKKKKAAV